MTVNSAVIQDVESAAARTKTRAISATEQIETQIIAVALRAIWISSKLEIQVLMIV